MKNQAPLASVSLDDKYTVSRGRVFLTGAQVLTRLPMVQRERDAAQGLNTAGFISGYRGSPLGSLDQNLFKAERFLKEHHIHFQPGVNEDLAATAIWGSQQVNLFRGAKYDGVFGMWYGKGPGVDRSGDVFKHANASGTSKFGGVLALAGDDHACISSTLPHQSELMFQGVAMPLLAPAGLQEYIDFGLHGWAMSRYAGCWVAFKAVADAVESSASVYIDPLRIATIIPTDYALPAGGLNVRWPDPPLVQEARLFDHKLNAALAYCRANKLNQVVIDSPQPRFGIMTCGKSYLDVRQALADLGIDEKLAAELGIRLYKVGMVWPLESTGVRDFAVGLEEILVVEEKRAFLEYQLKDKLYDARLPAPPRVTGKFDEHGAAQLPATGELSPAVIARVIALRLARFYTSERIEERLTIIDAKERLLSEPSPMLARTPYFCPGCPHNTSTRVPEGSRAAAGIGCHYMSIWMDRNTATFTHMGGEGASWIGQAPFTDEKHIFANIGDGTYFHSGMLAIRAAVAAQAPMTYKILYNDAVAMTGGQHVDGILTVPQMTRQLAAEGVGKIVVVTDEPEKYPSAAGFAPGVQVYHRRELDRVQRELREFPAVSALVYDQTCAAEKRRRRKRGTFPDPQKRAFINAAVCEGCGDCSVKSNCLSIEPLETEFGRKRAINQSSCNKDYSCIEGFCPSFVTVEGGGVRRGKAPSGADDFPELPVPAIPSATAPYSILITGIGGTGVVTIGALLGMAAHLEGKGVSVLDMAGLAQKGGAVVSHVRIADTPEDIHAPRIAAGGADAVIGCDLVVTAGAETVSKMQAGITRAVVNRAETPTADFTRNPDWQFPAETLEREVENATGAGAAHFVNASELATTLMGDAIASNLFLLGYAWQKGLIPLSAEAITRAIELNAVAVEANQKSFLWGRRAAHDVAAVERLARPAEIIPIAQHLSRTLDETIARRVDYLTAYQDAAYAARYRKLVARVQRDEAEKTGSTHLTEAVARYYFKLLAYKDEYEVARLYTEPQFMQRVHAAFEGEFALKFHLAPPLLAKRNSSTGEPRKIAFGPWMMSAFRVLAKLKGLRGTAFDIFGYTAERKMERALIAEYEQDIEDVLSALTAENHATAIEIVSLPEHIRGFGHIKTRNVTQAREQRERLFTRSSTGRREPRGSPRAAGADAARAA